MYSRSPDRGRYTSCSRTMFGCDNDIMVRHSLSIIRIDDGESLMASRSICGRRFVLPHGRKDGGFWKEEGAKNRGFVFKGRACWYALCGVKAAAHSVAMDSIFSVLFAPLPLQAAHRETQRQNRIWHANAGVWAGAYLLNRVLRARYPIPNPQNRCKRALSENRAAEVVRGVDIPVRHCGVSRSRSRPMSGTRKVYGSPHIAAWWLQGRASKDKHGC